MSLRTGTQSKDGIRLNTALHMLFSIRESPPYRKHAPCSVGCFHMSGLRVVARLLHHNPDGEDFLTSCPLAASDESHDRVSSRLNRKQSWQLCVGPPSDVSPSDIRSGAPREPPFVLALRSQI